MISATEIFTFKIGNSRAGENIFPEKISYELWEGTIFRKFPDFFKKNVLFHKTQLIILFQVLKS